MIKKTFCLLAIFLFVDLLAAQNQDWTHYVRIAGHPLSMEIIDDIVSRQFRIGNDDHFVVRRFELGGKNFNLLDGSCYSGALNIVTRLERPKDDQEDPGSKIGKGALQRQANSQTGSAENSNK